MGLFDLFGKSFDDQVTEAINDVGATTPGVSGLSAEVRGKVVTQEPPQIADGQVAVGEGPVEDEGERLP